MEIGWAKLLPHTYAHVGHSEGGLIRDHSAQTELMLDCTQWSLGTTPRLCHIVA